ncbi:hypothetical protein [Actinoplanes sp. NPDC048796]|uniref:hypothetical protein n=1 Tax=Actinoplanes sp. NPDC048796 TaxID=3155640 RepID=UPI0033D5364E
MRHVTVLLDLRGVLGDVVATLLREKYGDPAVRVVPEGVALEAAVARSRPQMVITVFENEPDPAVVPPGLARLLRDHPRLRVLVVEGDGRSGSIWELQPHRIPLGELSPGQLIRAVSERVPPDFC